MQNERIKVTYGGTINVGDYSNVKLEVTFEALVDGAPVEDVEKTLMTMAWQAYVDEVRELAERNYTAQSYLAVIAPDAAAELRERKKAEMTNRTKQGE